MNIDIECTVDIGLHFISISISKKILTLTLILIVALIEGIRRRIHLSQPGHVPEHWMGTYGDFGADAKGSKAEHRVKCGEERDGQSDN